jgi:CheY-like chemotaxis protein
MAKTILLAADDPNIAYLLQRYAEASGFRTVQTRPDRDVLAVARSSQPALIILEEEPTLAGRSRLLTGLQAEPGTCHIPVVVYSYNHTADDAPPRGAVGYLDQTMLFDDFLRMLEDVGVQP